MEMKRPRKLNFNAPFLSTRRPSSYLEEQVSRCGTQQDRIPFCWEQAPGKPKNFGASEDTNEAFTPRLKPPPGIWPPPTEEDYGDLRHHLHLDDEACDADVEEDEDDGNDGHEEIFSLTEAIDLVEQEDRLEASGESNSQSNLDRLNLESVGRHSDAPSPNFMIERFLPDATALAAATSALSLSKNLNKNLPYLCHYPETQASKTVVESISSPKACGLEMVLPWRMRQRLSGVKSPVQPKCRAKQKKRFSSLHKASGEWSCK